jgi:hypothetical protein
MRLITHMITTKTTALLVAMTLIGAAPPAINAFADNVQVINQEDNDKVEQKNKAKVEQSQASVQTQGIGVLSPQTAANTQTSTVTQTNANVDNDVQTAAAVLNDQDVCGILIAFGIDC